MARGVADTSTHLGSAIRGLNCARSETANGRLLGEARADEDESANVGDGLAVL